MLKLAHVLMSWMVIVGIALGGYIVANVFGTDRGPMAAWGVVVCTVWACTSIWQTQWEDLKAVIAALRGA